MMGTYCPSIMFFFFSSRRRHTRFDCDWSSDVCSSDLAQKRGRLVEIDDQYVDVPVVVEVSKREIGRASCRERVEISVVAVSLTKKKESNPEGGELFRGSVSIRDAVWMVRGN